MSATEMSHADQSQEMTVADPTVTQAPTTTDANTAPLAVGDEQARTAGRLTDAPPVSAASAPVDRSADPEPKPTTKKELDPVFITAVQQLFLECETAVQTCQTSDDVVRSFHQTLLRILGTYADTYHTLGSSTWAPQAATQLHVLQQQHIDYSQDAKSSAVEQFNQVLQSTQGNLSGSLSWQTAAGLSSLVAHTAYYVTLPVVAPLAWLAGVDMTPQFGSVLQNALTGLKAKFDAALKTVVAKQEAVPVDAAHSDAPATHDIAEPAAQGTEEEADGEDAEVEEPETAEQVIQVVNPSLTPARDYAAQRVQQHHASKASVTQSHQSKRRNKKGGKRY